MDKPKSQGEQLTNFPINLSVKMVLGTMAKISFFHQEENGEKEPEKNPGNPEGEKSDFPIRVSGSIHLNRTEWQRLNALKELDLQQCEFCDKVNLFNLG